MRSLFAAVGMLALSSVAFAQDPVKIDPQHHKVEFENAQVRVLRITFGPHEKTPVHEHPASVAVFLTDAKNRVSPAEGPANEEPRKRGDVVAVNAGKHMVENLGDAPIEIALVELKTPAKTPWTAVALDPVKVDPKHYSVVVENDRVRVLRVTTAPGEQSAEHEHGPNVVVFLTGNANAKPGSVVWDAGQKHASKNETTGQSETILVELKTGTGSM